MSLGMINDKSMLLEMINLCCLVEMVNGLVDDQKVLVVLVLLRRNGL
jgi:hypothetical protein